jgi:hypothetical protein
MILYFLRRAADCLPRALAGVALIAFAAPLGGFALSIPAQAMPLPPSGCYASGNVDGEGNKLFHDSGHACFAPTSTAGSDRWDTTGYAGISFSIGEDFNPHFSVGLRHTNVNAGNFVYGGEVNASVSLIKGLEDAQIRLLGIAGNANTLGVGLLGNAGIGWDLGANSLLLNAGLQVPYARLFVDYTIDDNSLRAFFEANSYGRIEAVQNSLTCGAGTIIANGAEILRQYADLSGGTDVSGDIFDGFFNFEPSWPQYFTGTPSAAFVDGQTCFKLGDNPLG